MGHAHYFAPPLISWLAVVVTHSFKSRLQPCSYSTPSRPEAAGLLVANGSLSSGDGLCYNFSLNDPTECHRELTDTYRATSKTIMAYKVFISHSSIDTWVARQLARYIEDLGASTFLDEADIEYGDDFEERILEAIRTSQELLVLLTPWALKRPYIWLEIGAIWGLGRRVIGVLHGLSPSELVAQDGTPALLKRIDLVELNNIGMYFEQLQRRIPNVGDRDD